MFYVKDNIGNGGNEYNCETIEEAISIAEDWINEELLQNSSHSGYYTVAIYKDNKKEPCRIVTGVMSIQHVVLMPGNDLPWEKEL